MLYALVALALMTPIMTVSAFIVGYNVNAPKKITMPKLKKEEKQKSEDEIMLERIDKARI